MSIFDIILLVVLAGCALRGLTTGLIKTVGSLVGLIGGAFLASHFYLALFALISNWFAGYDNIGKVVCFIVIFVIASWIIHLIFVVLDKTYDFLSVIPFLKSINRLAGAILGLLVGGLVIGLLLYVATKYFPFGTTIGNWLSNSQVAPYLLGAAKILLPFLSGSLKSLQSII